MAYRVIRELNSELREKGIATVQGKVSKKYLLERYFGGTAERGAEQCRQPRLKTALGKSAFGTRTGRARASASASVALPPSARRRLGRARSSRARTASQT